MTAEDTEFSIIDDVTRSASDHQEAAIQAREVRSDHFLINVVANTNDLPDADAMELTLAVGGQIITGTLTAAINYFKVIEAGLVEDDDTFSTEDLGTEKGPLSDYTAIYRIPADERPLPVYIHLKNARYVFGNGNRVPSEGNEGLWWRGRIERVDGFSFGRIVQGPQKKA